MDITITMDMILMESVGVAMGFTERVMTFGSRAWRLMLVIWGRRCFMYGFISILDMNFDV